MLNLSVLQGRLVSNPELRHTQSGVAVTSFTIANETGYGEKKKTNFVDVIAWRSTAELVCKWFTKGSAIIVQGSIQTRSYTDKDGNKRKVVEIVADNVHFADSKKDGDGGRAQAAGYQPDISYTTGNTGDFEEVPDSSDLPF